MMTGKRKLIAFDGIRSVQKIKPHLDKGKLEKLQGSRGTSGRGMGKREYFPPFLWDQEEKVWPTCSYGIGQS